jgi:predicted N-acyltransferase
MLRVLSGIDAVRPEAWNALIGGGDPFLRHEFLAALEHHGCVGPQSGWTPCHLVIEDRTGALRAALPLYRKMHSWGEFVFDFSWAQAYARSGLEYYPKLVATVPFTPAGGPRLLVSPGPDARDAKRELLAAAIELAREESVSSLHVLFAHEPEIAELSGAGLLLRRDCQFHWHNRGYGDFEHYLKGFTAEKRKKTRRERRRVQEAGIAFTTLHGGDLDERTWRVVYAFHADTFLRHGHTPYLSLAFFRDVARTMPQSIVVQLASRGRQPLAAAICFRGSDTLYGRYWGASEDQHSLHFEACYHQGIEYCIREGLSRFEPGTQGEHKVARGFEPVFTWSAHWIADPRFARAIGDFLQRESRAVAGYAEEIREHVPYRKEQAGDPAQA